MDYLNFTCQGESHKADNKVCQDFSLTSSSAGTTVAVVCDGHGGNRYFRSNVGAEYAAKITEKSVRSFVKQVDPSILIGKPFTAVGPVSELPDNYKETEVDRLFRQLFSSIIFKWNEMILEHAAKTPINVWESEHVEQKYLDDFLQKKSLEKTYGCTLMVFVKTKQYWFAFHIGDGKCITLQNDPVWKEPVPWDERCFLNKTTSLCDSDAINEFRYCYQGDGQHPAAVFLGSDGIDDSFGETSNMVNFYIQIAKEILNAPGGKVKMSLKETLPQLSRMGSRDDMSVACVYDKPGLKNLYKHLVQWQIDNVETSIASVDKKIAELEDRKLKLSQCSFLDDKNRIELQYAENDILRLSQQKSSLVKKQNVLLQEKNGKNAVH